jgi:Flp pilus assembly protein TadD
LKCLATAASHLNLGIALKAQGKLAEAIAEFRKARDNAQPGSGLAQAIERALTATDH